MKIIVFTKRYGGHRQFDLRQPAAVATTFCAVLMLGAALFGIGFFAAQKMDRSEDLRSVVLEQELQQQKAVVARLRDRLNENLDALSMRLGHMQAHVIRLDAMGERLTAMADLGDGEFDFSSSPPRGGPETPVDPTQTPLPDFAQDLEQLSFDLQDREAQLAILENLLMTRNLYEQVYPEGRPVDSGWISSYFGRRSDPFTGKRTNHEGVDFAGVAGAPVMSVAAGVVSFVGVRSGYGNIVEINHGNGFVTRYAHNQVNLVEPGSRIEKGQTVALMGSTGRATGPNLHFEVLHRGRVVDPLKYIRKGSG